MKKFTSTDAKLNRKEAEKLAEEFKKRDIRSYELYSDFGKIISKHAQKDQLEIEDFLFGLSKISAAFIDRIQLGAIRPGAKEYAVNKYLEYLGLNLTEIETSKKLNPEDNNSNPVAS